MDNAEYNAPTSPAPARLKQPPGSYITNSYDVMARWTGTTLKNSQHSTLNSHLYDYDDASRRTKQTRIGGTGSTPSLFTNTVDYTYDDIGQLKTATGKESDGTSRQNEQLG